nr:hypothetical protein [Tanacetum cinerariifolium]
WYGGIVGDAGSGGDGICGNVNDNGGLKDILAVTQSVGGGGIESAEAGCSSSSSSSSRSSSGSDSRMYPGESAVDSRMYLGESAVGEAAAGSGCSSAGKTSSSGGIYSGYSDSATTYAYGSFGITGGLSSTGDTSSDRPSQGLDTVVYVTVESSESDMIVSENTK